MNALLLLYRLQAKALYRRLTRNLRSIKGAFLFFFGILVVLLWLAPSIWQAFWAPRTPPQPVREAAPVILLTMCLLALVTSGGEKAIAFTPAEIDFLFPGPFTRRQLLAYKICKSLAGILFSSLLLSVVFLRHAAGWLQGWSAVFFALLFVQLFGMAITLIAQSAGERAYTRSRKLILGVIIIAIVIAVLPALKGGNKPGFFEIARLLRQSRIGSILLAPLDAFGQLFTASRWLTALLYAGACIGIDLLLLLIVFYLDADYLEAAASRSQALYERLQRVRKGGLGALAAPGKKVRGAIPQLPHLAGAGPIAWRQATAALRNSKGLLLLMAILAVAIGPLLFTARKDTNLSGAVIGAMAWLTLIVGAWLRFDFRGDLDQMDNLKALPVSSLALAAGQIVTPILLMTLCHLAIVGSVMAVSRKADIVLVSAAILCLPFNALLFGVENVMFLLFPTRTAATPADFQGYGRQILLLFAKGAVILIAGALAAVTALIVHRVSNSWPPAIAAATVILSAIAASMLPLVAWAFNRFDVSQDLPA